MADEKSMEKLVSLCRRRGFIFQSSEIYGGINGFWDYGPLGVELKRNIKEAWWQDMVRNPPLGPDGKEIQMVGLDCSIIMNPKVWVASGHVGGFSDPMVDCKECRKRFRADKVHVGLYFNDSGQAEAVYSVEGNDKHHAKELIETHFAKLYKKRERSDKPLPKAAEIRVADVLETRAKGVSVPIPCPMPECKGELTEARAFNLMFQTMVGAVQSEDNVAYLRPETAQGIFANFKNVLDSSRVKVPFGIAQIGKAFRNEINPRNYTFRSREFEQMEIEFFCPPSESMKWYQFWRDVRLKWYSSLGIRSERLVPREQGKEELAHYSIGTTDIEYIFPFADEPQELEGVAHRGAFDLNAHMKHSGQDLTYFDEALWEQDKAGRTTNSFKAWVEGKSAEQIEKYRYVPHVIEPSAGADRFTLAVLCEAYTEDKQPDEKGALQERVVMKFHPRLAPIKAAILPLVNKDGMPEKAEKLYLEMKKHLNVYFDDGGAIGRRYRRQDEIGTPFCITIDGQTMQDDTVTIRDRDSLVQKRIPIQGVLEEVKKALV